MMLTTYTGIPYTYSSLPSMTIRMADVANALSSITLFNGCATHPMTEAQHAVYLSMVVGEEYHDYGLIHNFWRAYIPDVMEMEKSAPILFAAKKDITTRIRDHYKMHDERCIKQVSEVDHNLRNIAAKTLLANPEYFLSGRDKTETHNSLKEIDKNFHIWTTFQAKSYLMLKANESLGELT